MLLDLTLVLLISLLLVRFAIADTAVTSAIKRTRTTEYEQRSCSFVQGLHANLIRFITQEGFHRDLEDTVEVTVTTSSIPMKHFTTGECLLGILHELSRDVYVDPYEILREPSLSEHIRVLNAWTDLESPSWLAKSNSTVFIQLQPVLTGNLISAEPIQLPIHYRYQMPRSHSRMRSRGIRTSTSGSGSLNSAGYIPVTLPLPELIFRCESWDTTLVENKCKTTSVICHSKADSSSKCPWVMLPYKSNLKSGTVYVPIGDTDSTFLITSITVIVVLGGMLFLMLTLIRAKRRLDADANRQSESSSTHAHAD